MEGEHMETVFVMTKKNLAVLLIMLGGSYRNSFWVTSFFDTPQQMRAMAEEAKNLFYEGKTALNDVQINLLAEKLTGIHVPQDRNVFI